MAFRTQSTKGRYHQPLVEIPILQMSHIPNLPNKSRQTNKLTEWLIQKPTQESSDEDRIEVRIEVPKETPKITTKRSRRPKTAGSRSNTRSDVTGLTTQENTELTSVPRSQQNLYDANLAAVNNAISEASSTEFSERNPIVISDSSETPSASSSEDETVRVVINTEVPRVTTAVTRRFINNKVRRNTIASFFKKISRQSDGGDESARTVSEEASSSNSSPKESSPLGAESRVLTEILDTQHNSVSSRKPGRPRIVVPIDDLDPRVLESSKPLNLKSLDEIPHVDMNVVVNIFQVFDFFVKFENVIGVTLVNSSGARLTYDDLEEMALDRNHCHTRLFLLVCEFLDYLMDDCDEKSKFFPDLLTVQHRLSRLLSSRVFLRSTEYIYFPPHERLTLLKDMINQAMRTDPAREQIKEWCDKLNDCAKQKKLRHVTIENLQNEIPELKAKVKLLEKEIKEIEVQLKNHHSGIDTESDDARSEESASGVTARQRAVARAQAARDAEEALRVKRIRAAEEAESFERLIGIKQLEYDNLVSLNTTEREDLKNSLVGGSVIRAAGNSANHELYQFAQLGQDRYCRNYWFYRPIGGIFVEDVEWYRSYNKERMDSNGKAAENGESSDEQLKRQSRWWVIDSIEAYRAFKNSLNPRGVRERALEASLKKIEDEIIESFKRLNEWMERRLNDTKEIQQENVERDVVKKALQRDGDIHKIVARIVRDMSTLTVCEYECIMCEAIRRKLKVFEACLVEMRPDFVIEQADFDLNSCSKPEKFFEYIKKLISSTGIVMSEPTNDEEEPTSAKTATSSNEEQLSNDQSPSSSFKWLAIASSRWYWSDIRTFSSVCVMLDELIEAHDIAVKANAKLKKANKSLSRGLSKKSNDTTDAEDEDTDGTIEEGRSHGRGGKDIVKLRSSRRLQDKPKINYDESSINKGGGDESLNVTISKYQTRSASRLRPDQTLIQDEMTGPVTVSEHNKINWQYHNDGRLIVSIAIVAFQETPDLTNITMMLRRTSYLNVIIVICEYS
ncbi:11305_t:CDS:2 [Paraglomus occultum]|uniref:11305_t:CDS:1 n=1 Tax=Paraglomus occultum TaxID=144539 RepID=A0A9N8W491_9GLOM|nr:11305_t:CDS:2 [Paraglomus occultum]